MPRAETGPGCVLDSEATIRVRGLMKSFGRVRAVDDLSFEACRGEVLGLLGPNGAGKTTTIQMLLGLTKPNAGKIEILGLDLARRRRAIMARVNFTSAYIALPSNLTVEENLSVFAMLYGVRKPARRIRELLELLEIPETARKPAGALSSGQATRLNLCKALINDPEVLFLDEPTASLDPAIAAKVRRILGRIARDRGMTMIYTSHNMAEVETMCDRVIFLLHGRVAAEGPPAEVVRRAGSRTLEDVFIEMAEAEIRERS